MWRRMSGSRYVLGGWFCGDLSVVLFEHMGVIFCHLDNSVNVLEEFVSVCGTTNVCLRTAQAQQHTISTGSMSGGVSLGAFGNNVCHNMEIISHARVGGKYVDMKWAAGVMLVGMSGSVCMAVCVVLGLYG